MIDSSQGLKVTNQAHAATGLHSTPEPIQVGEVTLQQGCLTRGFAGLEQITRQSS